MGVMMRQWSKKNSENSDRELQKKARRRVSDFRLQTCYGSVLIKAVLLQGTKGDDVNKAKRKRAQLWSHLANTRWPWRSPTHFFVRFWSLSAGWSLLLVHLRLAVVWRGQSPYPFKQGGPLAQSDNEADLVVCPFPLFPVHPLQVEAFLFRRIIVIPPRRRLINTFLHSPVNKTIRIGWCVARGSGRRGASCFLQQSGLIVTVTNRHPSVLQRLKNKNLHCTLG